MKLRHLKEFYAFVDILLSTINKDDKMQISLVYSGIIQKETDDNVERTHVTEAPAKITAEYTESGITVNSITVKTVASWLNDCKQGTYTRANSYLSFLVKADSIDVTSVVINDVDLTKRFTNEYGTLNLFQLSEYAVENSGNDNIRYNLTDGQKLMTFVYSDHTFTRLVKIGDKHTLYINGEKFMNKIIGKKYVDNFAYCTGMPDIMTQVELFRKMAIDDKCKFDVVSDSTRKAGEEV